MQIFVNFLKRRWNLLYRTMGPEVDPEFRSQVVKLLTSPTLIVGALIGLYVLVLKWYSADPLPLTAVITIVFGGIVLVTWIIAMAGMIHHANVDRIREIKSRTEAD